jgi:hypothetical protein
MENFDDLFNSFLGKNNDNNEDNHGDELSDNVNKIIDMINSFKNINTDSKYSYDDLEKLDGELDDKLGIPDKVVHSKDGDMYIEKRMWFKEHGIIIKTVMNDVPFKHQVLEPELTLEEQLAEAVKDENYELAATLRDQIKKIKAKAKRLEKKILKESEKN